MNKKFDPAERNLAANPALRKTNSPWPFFIAIIVIGLVVLVCRAYFTPEVRIARPTVESLGDRATATTVATNRTDAPVTLKVRIKIGHMTRDTQARSGRFVISAQQDVSVAVASHSTAPIKCEFLLPKYEYANLAEAELIHP